MEPFAKLFGSLRQAHCARSVSPPCSESSVWLFRLHLHGTEATAPL
jgi:hypothetical protein